MNWYHVAAILVMASKAAGNAHAWSRDGILMADCVRLVPCGEHWLLIGKLQRTVITYPNRFRFPTRLNLGRHHAAPLNSVYTR